MMTDTHSTPRSKELAPQPSKTKMVRRRREIALLALSLGFVIAALALHEPFLILISLFPALASYGQR
jgi:hypothetical protein